MPNRQRWRRSLARWLLAGGLAGSAGCMGFVNPIPPPPPEQQAPCQGLPRGCREHVYVFLINGLDPVNCANLTGVRDYVQELGFRQTYYGQLYDTYSYESEIRRIHKEDADAHFVLIGFSLGANAACSIAHAVKEDGVLIDRLIYLGGNTLKNVPADQPDNAARIINILAEGYLLDGDALAFAENVNLSNAWHFGSPSHPQTLAIVTHELTAVAALVSVRQPLPSAARGTMAGPTTAAVPPGPRGEWDFLKPVALGPR